MALLGLARPALIISHQRTGSTMLCEALSNHPDVFCVREEPYHRDSLWRRQAKNPAAIIWAQHYYKVAMFRIMANSLLGGKQGLEALIQAKKPKVIHLHRRDLVSQAVSIEINAKGFKGHPTHCWKPQNPKPVQLRAGKIAHRIRDLQKEQNDLRRWFRKAGLEVLELTYESLVGDPPKEVEELDRPDICRFLDVRATKLPVTLKKLHKGDLNGTVMNLRSLLSHPVVRAASRD